MIIRLLKVFRGGRYVVWVLLLAVCGMLTGCPDPQFDEVLGGFCCCEEEDLFCHDDEYTRGLPVPNSIELAGLEEILEGFGVICKAEASGGEDLDFLFPEIGDEWYQYCPECSTYEECNAPESSRICCLQIENTFQPFYWGVSGYIEEGNETDPNDSSSCYFAVDSTYPIPENNSGEIFFEVIRFGAHQPEWVKDSNGEWVSYENQSALYYSISLSEMEPARTFSLPWAANASLDVSRFIEAVPAAAESARYRQTDNPNSSTSFIERYNNAEDKNVNMHLVEERITPQGITLPLSVEVTSQEYMALQQQLIQQGILVLVVSELTLGGSPTIGVWS